MEILRDLSSVDYAWKVGDRCWIESWGEARPCTLISLYSPTPLLLYDCQIKLEDCGQVVPYHRDRLKRLGLEPTHGAP